MEGVRGSNFRVECRIFRVTPGKWPLAFDFELSTFNSLGYFEGYNRYSIQYTATPVTET